jgi:heme/copper-type cytochrome/quinol oxidase subunit 3
MLFGALFASYILLRIGAPSWPDQSAILNVPMATLNTAVLITSSVTMVMAWASLVRGQLGRFRLYMGGTVLLGLVFLVVKYFEYSAKFHHDLFPSTNTFLAIYFTLTGLHGLHVLGGMVVNAWYVGPGSKLWRIDRQQFTNRVETAGLFWHFVDLVWIFLFPVLYLL